MAAFLLIHGAGGSAWSWSLVRPHLEAAGHQVVAPSMPCDDPDGTLHRYVATALDALDAAGAGDPLVVVGHSLGALVAPIVAAERGAAHLVLVAPMIPKPGESGGEWWQATGHAAAFEAAAVRDGRDPTAEFDAVEWFLHDVPAPVVEAANAHVRDQGEAVFRDPCPLLAWPDVPTTVIACTGDRFFPPEFVRATALERVGVEPVTLATGHVPMLAAPETLAAMLVARV